MSPTISVLVNKQETRKDRLLNIEEKNPPSCSIHINRLMRLHPECSAFTDRMCLEAALELKMKIFLDKFIYSEDNYEEL